MTDTDKESVLNLASDHDAVAGNPDKYVMGHPHHTKTANMLRALTTRIAELEAENKALWEAILQFYERATKQRW